MQEVAGYIEKQVAYLSGGGLASYSSHSYYHKNYLLSDLWENSFAILFIVTTIKQNMTLYNISLQERQKHINKGYIHVYFKYIIIKEKVYCTYGLS